MNQNKDDDEINRIGRELSTGSLTRRQIFKGAAAGSLVIGAGGLLAACGSSDSGTSAPAANGDIKKGGTIRIGVTGGSAADTVDAHMLNTDADAARGRQLYEPLLMRDGEYNVEMVLAESFEPTESGQVDDWTVKLRPDITFHDGTPLTADAVISTIRRIVDPKRATTVAPFLSGVDLNKMKKLDKLTLRIGLKTPNAGFPDDIGQYSLGIVPEGYDAKNPVGTGPYKFKSFSPGQQSSFVKYEDYWREGPNFDEVVILDLAEDTARLNALRSGNVDAISNLPVTQLATIEQEPALTALVSECGNFQPITMRVDRAPFDDNRVRQAFKLIVDRPQMVAQALGGKGRPANDIPAPFDPLYASDIPQREQDIEEAKSLLKQADRSDLTVTLRTAPLYAGVVEAAQVFAQQAKDAGVNVKVQKVDTDSFYGPSYLNATFSQDYWFTRGLLGQIAYQYLPESTFNEAHYDNPEFNKLVAEGQAEADDAKRKEIMKETQELMRDDSGILIHSFSDQIDAYSADLVGFKTNKGGRPLSDYDFRTTGRA